MSSAATSPAWEPDALAAFGAAVGILEAEAAADLSRYLYNPVRFARECIDWDDEQGLTPYQEDILTKLIDSRRVAVRGPHGLGKTTTNAVAVIWFAVTRDAAGVDWKAVTTAGAWRQLEKYLWPEIHKWSRRLRWDVLGLTPWRKGRELLDLSIGLTHGEAFAVASDNPALIEGVHGDHVLYVYDESKAIAEATFDASEGAFSGAGEGSQLEAYGLAQSTPGAPVGRFYDIHVRKPGLEDWHTRHVTVDEAISAGRISEEWRAARERQWAITAPAMYHNRVLGEFHPDDEDGVIPLSWLEAAHTRWQVWDDAGRPEQPGRRLLGVDVADGGGDLSAIATRQGDVVFDVETLNVDNMELAGVIVGRLSRQPHSIAIIDNIGVGSGTFRRTREQAIGATPFTAGAKTDRRDVTGEFGFANCLTETARVRPIGQLRRIYRSRYEGPLFEVEMASGDKFTATPNHNVLTPRGWVAVQSLNVGDQLCDSARGDSASRTPLVRPEVDDMPTEIGQLYRAASILFGSKRVQSGTVNFHGDRPVGDVDVVTVDRHLLTRHPSLGQHSEQGSLIRALLGPTGLAGEGRSTQPLGPTSWNGRVTPTLPDNGMASRPLGALGQREPVVRQVDGLPDRAARNTPLDEQSVNRSLMQAERHAQSLDGLASGVPGDDVVRVSGVDPTQASALGQRPWLDSVFGQSPADDVPVDPEIVSQRVQGIAGQIPLDEVASINRVVPDSPWHDGPFVYTLETSTGSYGTTNAVHRNCKAAAWWNLREMLDPALHPTLALPPDDDLTGDLTAPKWRVTSSNKIQIESKDELRKRIGRSTDRGDAVVQVCWLSSGAMNNEPLEAEPIDQAARLAGELAAVPFFNDTDWMGAA